MLPRIHEAFIRISVCNFPQHWFSSSDLTSLDNLPDVLQVTLNTLVAFVKHSDNTSLVQVHKNILNLDTSNFLSTEQQLNVYGTTLLSSVEILLNHSEASKTHELMIRNATVAKMLKLLRLVNSKDDVSYIITLLRRLMLLHKSFATAFGKKDFEFCLQLCISGELLQSRVCSIW